MSPTRPVLIIDDDPAIREALLDCLGDEGHVAEAFAEGAPALVHLRTAQPPGLILLDWNMAPMNGAEFLTALAREPGLARIPVAVVTADARVLGETRGANVVAHLGKPVKLEVLYALVERYCAASG